MRHRWNVGLLLGVMVAAVHVAPALAEDEAPLVVKFDVAQRWLRPDEAMRAKVELLVVNDSAEVLAGTLHYQLLDRYFRPACAGERELALGAKGRVTVPLELDLPACDNLRLVVRARFGEREVTRRIFLRSDVTTGPRRVWSLAGKWEGATAEGLPFDQGPTGFDKAVELNVPDGMRLDGKRKVVWLRRKLVLPEWCRLERYLLHFEGIGHATRVFLNGHEVAAFADPWVPHRVDLTEYLRPDGENELAIGVHDISLFKDAQHPRRLADLTDGDPGKPPQKYSAEVWGYRLYAPQGLAPDSVPNGIRLPLYVEATPAVRVDALVARCQVAPNRLVVSVRCMNDGTAAWTGQLQLHVLDAGAPAKSGPSVALTLPAGGELTIKQTLDWPDVKLWWPHEPNLYELVGELTAPDGRTVDRGRDRFGFREIAVRDGGYHINGLEMKPRLHTVYPGWGGRDAYGDYHGPLSLATFAPLGVVVPTLGRTHTAPCPPAAPERCDEGGLLLMIESGVHASGIQNTYAYEAPVFYENLAYHMAGIVAIAGNHPSVVAYSLENEAFVCGAGAMDKSLDRFAEVGRYVGRLDPTRWYVFNGDADLQGRTPYISLHYPRIFSRNVAIPNSLFWLQHGVKQRIDSWPGELFWDPAKPVMVEEDGWLGHDQWPHGQAAIIGDVAYSDKEARGEAHGLALMYQAMGYRAAGVSGHHPWHHPEQARDYGLVPVAALLRDEDTSFYGGQTITRRFQLHNDVLWPERLALSWKLSAGDSVIDEATVNYDMQPGEMRFESVSVPLPEVDKPTAYRFSWELQGKHGRWYKWHRDWTVHRRQPLRAPGNLATGIYDPQGATQAALAKAGLKPQPIPELTDASLGSLQLLLLGRDAVGKQFPKSVSDVLAKFVLAGGRVFAFSQTDPPDDWLPLPLKPGSDANLTRVFRRVPDHFLVADLAPNDLIYWRGDHLVTNRPFAKPTRGRFLPIIDGGLGLAETPLLELPLGDGLYWLSQLKLTEKLATEPAACMILQALLDGVRRPADKTRPLFALAASPAADYLRELHHPVAALNVTTLPEGGVILVEAAQLPAERQAAIEAWVRAGGTLWLRNLTPDDRARLAAHWPWLPELEEQPVDHLVKAKPHSLLDGISNAELYWAEPVYEGKQEIAKIVHFVVKAASTTAEASAWRPLTDPAGLAVLPLDSGRIVLDQIQWARAREQLGARSARLALLLAQAVAAPDNTAASPE